MKRSIWFTVALIGTFFGCGDDSNTSTWQGLHVGRVAEGFELDDRAGVGGLDEAVLAAAASYGIDTSYLVVDVERTLGDMHERCDNRDDLMPGCTYFVGGNGFITGHWDSEVDAFQRSFAIAHQLQHMWQYQYTGDPDYAHARQAEWGVPVRDAALELASTLKRWQCEHNEVCQ